MTITEIIKGRVKTYQNGAGDIWDEENNHIADARGWGRFQHLDNGDDIHDKLTAFIVDAINEKLGRIVPIEYPEGAELLCNQCNKCTTYEKALSGTIKITDDYTKEINVCPNCLHHSCLVDCEPVT